MAAAMPWSESEAEAVSGGSSTESTPANSGGEAKVREAPTLDHLVMGCLCSFYLFLGLKWRLGFRIWANGYT